MKRRKKNKKMLQTLKKELLTYSPMLLAALWLWMGVEFNFSSHLALSVFFFLSGWAGVIIMVKKEAPSIRVSYHGKKAVITGALITGVSWFASIVALLDS